MKNLCGKKKQQRNKDQAQKGLKVDDICKDGSANRNRGEQIKYSGQALHAVVTPLRGFLCTPSATRVKAPSSIPGSGKCTHSGQCDGPLKTVHALLNNRCVPRPWSEIKRPYLLWRKCNRLFEKQEHCSPLPYALCLVFTLFKLQSSAFWEFALSCF